ncbi:MAG: C/D box methylation guide ribonucleoprotein complex aNOP56 subunit [Candidatus Bathyarchaeota archaeon]|nr:MAG: C/D box methylation guide ribonucleoprotein complex aNOP56 subunit [Candidatus Bathyarchaeota archaeon]
MRTTIAISLMGVLALTDGQVIDKILFKKDPKHIAQKLNSIDSGQVIDEISSLVKKMKNEGYTTFVLENSEIAEKLGRNLKVKTVVAHPSPEGEMIRENIEEIAIKMKFAKESQKLRDLIREVSLELAKMRVRKAGEKRDLMIALAMLSIDDLDKTINLFMGRIREWYGLHFPELDRLIENHETYAKLVLNLGRRVNFNIRKLEKEGLPSTKAASIVKAAEKSMGAKLADADIKQVQKLCRETLELYGLRKAHQKYANLTIEEVAPNTQALVGSLLAGRLIALAGGLKNLAKMPASTIQVLGAEKALFRALKTGTKPPKHGIIFQDTLIHDAKKWQRGKMSRALAGKLAIAARADAYSHRYIGDDLKSDLAKRVDEIKEKYQKPQLQKALPKSKDKRRSNRRRRKKRGSKR